MKEVNMRRIKSVYVFLCDVSGAPAPGRPRIFKTDWESESVVKGGWKWHLIQHNKSDFSIFYCQKTSGEARREKNLHTKTKGTHFW